MNWRVLPSWLKGHVTNYRRQVAIALALGLIASGFAALLMFTAGYLISATALAETTLFSIMIPIASVQLFGFGKPLAHYAERLASHNWVLRVTSDLRLSLFQGIEQRMGDPALEQATGVYLGLLSDDVAHLQNLYLRVVFPSAIAYLLALGAALLFGFFSLPFALIIVFAFAATCILLPFCTLTATRTLIEQARAHKANATTRLTDDVFGSLDWVLAGRSADVLHAHAETDRATRSIEISVRSRQRAFSLASALLLGFLSCAVLIWSGALFGGSHATANWIAAFTLGFFPLIEAFTLLPAAISESSTHRSSISRLDEHIGNVAHLPEAKERIVSPISATSKPRPEVAIEVQDCVYRYPGQSRDVLTNLSLEVPAGQSLAILGRSGSGKSTLAKAICQTLIPDAGYLCVQGAVGFLGQAPYLFNRTLRDNVNIGRFELDDGRIQEILRRVGLSEVLASRNIDLDTIIGETGTGFSGGEAHRIALARVLAADTPIIVVDEPFSALDPETERALLDTLLDVCANRTLVVITHHLAEIQRFDRVVFIEDGAIALDGSPSSLLADNDRFRTLVAFDQ